MQPKNIKRIQELASKIFDMADTRIYYEGDADCLPEEAEEILNEFGAMLREEFGIDIKKMMNEDGLVAEWRKQSLEEILD